MNNTLDQKITTLSLIKFTIPSMVMMMVMSLYTVADGLFVSRLIGTDAFSAVNIIYPMMSLVIGLGTMFGTGTTAIVSKKLGEKKHLEARQILSFIILVTMIIGGVCTVISWIFLDKIIYALGANEEIFAYCYGYGLPLIFFFVCDILQCQFQCLYIADGKPHMGLIVTTIGGVTNIILDYVFIAQMHMGISGAALATGIGYSVPAIYGLCYFTMNKKGNLYFVKPKLKWRALSHAVANGSSEMVTYLSGSITTLLFNIIMMKLIGQDGVAAMAVLLYLDFMLIALSMGYSMGTAPLISYNHGSGNKEKLRRIYKISIFLCGAIGLFMSMVTIIFAKDLASIFAEKHSAVYELAAAGLKIYAIGYLFKGFNVFSSAMFTAFGNGHISALLACLRSLVLLSGTLMLFSHFFGVSGVWFASPAAEGIAFIVSLLFTLKYWKKYYGEEEIKLRSPMQTCSRNEQ